MHTRAYTSTHTCAGTLTHAHTRLPKNPLFPPSHHILSKAHLTIKNFRDNGIQSSRLLVEGSRGSRHGRCQGGIWNSSRPLPPDPHALAGPRAGAKINRSWTMASSPKANCAEEENRSVRAAEMSGRSAPRTARGRRDTGSGPKHPRRERPLWLCSRRKARPRGGVGARQEEPARCVHEVTRRTPAWRLETSISGTANKANVLKTRRASPEWRCASCQHSRLGLLGLLQRVTTVRVT